MIDAVHRVEGDASLREAREVRRGRGRDVFGLVVLEHDDEDVVDEESEGETKSAGVDAIKNETLNILRDLIDLSRTPKTATASTVK